MSWDREGRTAEGRIQKLHRRSALRFEQIGITVVQLALINLDDLPQGDWLWDLAGAPEVWQNRVLTRLDEGRTALADTRGLEALVFFESPMNAIARRLQQGLSPSAAVVAWEDSVEELLAFSHRFEGRVAVIHGEVDAQTLTKLPEIVEQRTNIRLSHVGAITTVRSADQEDESGEAALFKVAASQLLQLRGPAELLDRLNEHDPQVGISTPISEVVAELLAEERAKNDRRNKVFAQKAELEAELRRAQESSVGNALLIEQLHKTQEELQKALRRYDDSKKRVQSLRRGRTYRRQKIEDLETRLVALRRGRNARRETITELEQELKRRDAKIKWLRSVRNDHRETARALRAELQDVRATVNSLESSRSWRYTKVLRKLNGTEA